MAQQLTPIKLNDTGRQILNVMVMGQAKDQIKNPLFIKTVASQLKKWIERYKVKKVRYFVDGETIDDIGYDRSLYHDLTDAEVIFADDFDELDEQVFMYTTTDYRFIDSNSGDHIDWGNDKGKAYFYAYSPHGYKTMPPVIVEAIAE